MKSLLYTSWLFIVLLLSALVGSCTDEPLYVDGDIPEGEGTLSGTVTFTPTGVADLNTRTLKDDVPGDALNGITSLCVLVYTSDGNLFKTYDSKSYENPLKYEIGKYEVDKENDHLDGNDAHTDEKFTAKATFTLNNLPFGLYKFYAVANMPDLLTEHSEAIETEDGLKHISLSWDPNNMKKNSEMFGYFTSGSNDSNGFDAPQVAFKPGTQIHAWLKRAASKVTVAFDPSGLRQGVNIYIRSVTIRDIPKNCLLGAVNTPKDVEELDNHINPPYPKPELNSESTAIANSRFEYNSKGLIEDGSHTGPGKTDGFELNNHYRNAVPDSAHNADAPSLFFYENDQQPNYDGMSKEQRALYDKRQQKGEVGTAIRDDDGKNDFKDRVPYGTYIEVEAYYISSNPENISEGPIKYRFMLGKDVVDNYNAQRNYHYKLTLGFKNWANNPDWHIDYDLPSPDVQVPPVFRVSYLYHQMSELPIRISGNCTKLEATITENNWAPYDPTSRNPWPVPNAETSLEPDPYYAFKWNYQAFTANEYMEDGKEETYFGFLALHLPSRETTIISSSYGPDANKELRTYYKDHHEGDRSFEGADLDYGTDKSQPGNSEFDHYNVNHVKDEAGNDVPNERTLMLPLWTRAKSLIYTSGFSGNNPYEGYERMAKIHIKAYFKNETVPIERDVLVLQVKRIVNPKGVWRAHNRTEPFDVTLLETENANSLSNFQPFESQGEWTAYIEGSTANTFSLETNSKTDGYKDAKGWIHGYTGSEIHFRIKFGGSVDENKSECAIVKILYHGNQCLHKILVRKGYNAPIKLGKYKWSSFSLYQASATEKTVDGRKLYEAVLTKNPLMLGSMFRRGRLDQGIFVWNNMQPGLGPNKAPGNTAFVVGLKKNNVVITPGLTGQTWVNQWESKSWGTLGYQDDRNTTNNCGVFYALEDDGKSYTKDENGNPFKYRVPTYDEFIDLTNSSDYGFGVFYGSAAKEPQTEADKAYGLIDPYNEGLFDSENGMRAVVLYDRLTGDQIVFPMGRYGVGVRRMFNLGNLGLGTSVNNTYAGNLHYSDVYQPLTISYNYNNLYRPIPYNLPIVDGCIYWIDQFVDKPSPVGACLGWDINYFNFDFNPYTANNWQDACPIKFILVE